LSESLHQHWPRENPRAVVALVHGLGEFCMRYDWVATQFVENGYAVISRDLPGHGPHAQPRGHINNFHEFLDAVDGLLTNAQTKYPGKPIILFGHSMGGLIIVRYTQTRRLPDAVKAVVLSSPSLQTSIPVSPTTIKFARVLARVWPTFQQSSRIAPEAVSRSAEIRDFYRSNKDILHKLSIKFLLEFLDAMDASVADSTRANVPVLTMQAGQDKLVSIDATTKFHETLSSPDKTFKLYPPCHHELLNEPEREEILSDILAWLCARGL
jgi:lysophospholipase